MPDYYLIRCTIERGGFTSERTFEILLADGGKLVGISNVGHLYDENGKLLSDEEPPFGETITGFVKCRKIRDRVGNTALVEVPSADLINVPEEELLEIGQ